MNFSELQNITHGKVVQFPENREVGSLLTDSRKAPGSVNALFFAIAGSHHNGHHFIQRLYDSGVRQFVVEEDVPPPGPDANVLKVASSLDALQSIAAARRRTFSMPVIGITGSNGKTIVKEWLYQLLSPDFKIVKNPASYNSQLGVPLSVWQMEKHHTLGIFEAGISTVGEMERLQKIINPTIGIFTNVGPAHDEGFATTEEKINEKLKLFEESQLLIYCRDHAAIHDSLRATHVSTLSWGSTADAVVRIVKDGKGYRITTKTGEFLLHPPFADAASLENCFHCVCVLLHLGFGGDEIAKRVAGLRAIPMRLEVKEGINQCQIIDDTYNNDLAGLRVSLDFLAHQNLKKKKRLILSDIHQSGLSDTDLIKQISQLLSANSIRYFIGIGPTLSAAKAAFPEQASFFANTEEFLDKFDFDQLQQEVILVKGARVFSFEKIVSRLQRKVHGTVMEIDLGALVHNFTFFRSLIRPETQVMAMVKAFAYGSGSGEIANLLQYHNVDYLGVAYADEGVELRKNNITLPVMVMNPSADSFETLLQYRLEPEVYNFRTLQSLATFLQGRPCTVHIKIDTGMRRLGFDAEEIDALSMFLADHRHINVASLFSHLAGADEAEHDDFTRQQANEFKRLADLISQRLGYRPLYHILNSSGILRFPEYQFDMVRLGIGLYGIDPTSGDDVRLRPVATLKTVISQIKRIPAGGSVGYGRYGRAKNPLTIATVAIGYADGFSRAFSRGVGKVLVNGHFAPVVGNVCMDMTMVDITGIPAREGDEVIIFGRGLPIQEVAKSAHTIPYEILTSTSERVKRIFVAESI